MDNRQGPAGAGQTIDARAWTQILMRYREPSGARSLIELGITFGPLVLLWVLMWASYYFGLLVAHIAARRSGRGIFGAAVHDPARLRARRILPPSPRQRLDRPRAGRAHLDAIRFLEANARHSSCDLGKSGAPWHRRCRYPDGARISGAVALAPPDVSALSPSGGDVRSGAGLSFHPAAAASVRLDAQLAGSLGSARWAPTLPSRSSSPR